MTVIEALVSTILGSAVLVGLHSFSQAQLTSMQNQATQIGVQSVARSMLEVIARDIRRGGLDPTCSKAFDGLSVAKGDQVTIQSDLDSSGAIDAAEEQITYHYNYSTRSIDRVSGGTSHPLLSDMILSGSSLRYFDGAGVELDSSGGGLGAAERDQVRRVRIELAFADNVPGRDQPMQARVATDVDLRNRYFLANTTCP